MTAILMGPIHKTAIPEPHPHYLKMPSLSKKGNSTQ